MKILFLIHSLDRGGAERQLIELVKGLDKAHFSATIATFYDGGPWRGELERMNGVELISLHRKGRWDVFPFLWRLWRALRASTPHIVHGYMEVPNELCLCLGRLVGAKVVWGLRRSRRDLSDYDWAERWSFRLGAWLSRFADLIIVNSWAGKRDYIARGYCGERAVVISNGIDTDRYRPDPDAGYKVRAEWGIGGRELSIGTVGRVHPMKDYPTFLKAASLLARERKDVRFVCVGDGSRTYKHEVQQLGERLGLDKALIWSDPRDDMPAVYSAFDIACSSSAYGEGFSNVVGEAMACSIPCTVTDVGDSSWIVGQTGVVVPPKHPQALADGWKRIMSMSEAERAAMGKAARERIVAKFSKGCMVKNSQRALQTLLNDRP